MEAEGMRRMRRMRVLCYGWRGRRGRGLAHVQVTGGRKAHGSVFCPVLKFIMPSLSSDRGTLSHCYTVTVRLETITVLYLCC